METIRFSAAGNFNQDDLKKISQRSKVQFARCSQCGKCSAGCPVAFAMDKTPREIIRLLQLGLIDDALQSKTIWLCASCAICSARCPRGIDIPAVMENLRMLAKEKGYFPVKKIDLFHQLFLNSVEKNGRVYEFGLILGRNLLGLRPFQDISLGPSMFLKGKISPIPTIIKDNAEVQKIFANVRKRGAQI